MEEKRNRRVTIAATGDILLHRRLYTRAEKKDGTGYDFSEMLENAKMLFQQGDIKIVNQESIIGGEEIGLSGFPRFNSPVEIGYLLKEFGVDIVNLANNHVLDKGVKGLQKSLENWEKIGIPYVGAYKSKEDRETLRIIHKNGLRVCFISYTKVMAGLEIPTKRYLVDFFEDPGVYKIRKRIEQIKKAELADVVVLSIHFGEEYHLLPTAEQIEISNTLSNAGADIILGHHPHVLQPPSYILNSLGKESFVIYSLGNFFTGQQGLFKQIGAYLTIDVEKPSEESALLKIDNPIIRLTYVDSSDEKTYKLYLLEDIVKNKKFIKTNVGNFESQKVYDHVRNHMRKWIPDLTVF